MEVVRDTGSPEGLGESLHLLRGGSRVQGGEGAVDLMVDVSQLLRVVHQLPVEDGRRLVMIAVQMLLDGLSQYVRETFPAT